ncbi:MAG TPA: alpha/beta fold hydrolase [Steroidobacteraceae bacterium]|nr:alpha/beta fold hydrolase [Steroidobacteraceae bacterium]
MSAPPQAPNPGDLHDEQVVALLRSGAHAMLLSAYFGEQEYRELCQYAKLAATRADPDGPVVYVLPGIMGSKLGSSRQSAHPVWLHPATVSSGGLLHLATPSNGEVSASGVMLPGYLKLKLMLEIGGFRPVLFPFDWRCDLFDLGRALLEHIASNHREPVFVVAHSMGGLVARAALTLDQASLIAKLVQLGAPNAGSFAPVQALRAVYPTVRKIASLDQQHTAEDLARKVFLSLPGLYQMLPPPEHCEGLDLFDAGSWPQDELLPNKVLLHEARECRSRLADATTQCSLIAGYGQETITGLRLTSDGFEYSIARDGDGTVPLNLAQWTSARTWYANETHGGLTNNNTVLAALVELLQRDSTEHLQQTAPRVDGRAIRVTNDRELRLQAVRKVQWDSLSLDSRRRILEPIISPEFL